MLRLFLAAEEDAPAPEAEELESGQRSARQSVLKAKKTASVMAMKGKKTAQRRSPSDSELPDSCPRGKQARNHET